LKASSAQSGPFAVGAFSPGAEAGDQDRVQTLFLFNPDPGVAGSARNPAEYADSFSI